MAKKKYLMNTREHPIFISKYSIWHLIVYLIALSSLFTILYFCFSDNHIRTTPANILFWQATTLLIIIFYLFRGLYKRPRVIIYSKEIHFVRIFNLKTEKFKKSDLHRWDELIKGDERYHSYTHLVFNNETLITLKDEAYANFLELREHLKNNQHNSLHIRKKKIQNEKATFLIHSFVIAVTLTLNAFFFHYDKDLELNDAIIIKGHLSQPIGIKVIDQSNESILVKLQEYENYNFTIVNTKVVALVAVQDLLKDTWPGKEIELAITKRDYEKLKSKKSNINLWDKIHHHQEITIVEIVANDLVYFSIDGYNYGRSEDQLLYFVLLLLPAAFVIIISLIIILDHIFSKEKKI